MPTGVTINSDMGEAFGSLTFGHDDDLMLVVDVANVACGFHSGDPRIMAETVAKTTAAGMSIGAHPGLPDLTGFGRRRMAVSPEEVRDLVTYQVGALSAFTDRVGVQMTHVKAHGALSGMVAEDGALMRPMAELAAQRGLAVLGIPGSAQEDESNAAGARFIGELYVDLN